MKTAILQILGVLMLSTLSASAQGTAFTYQGRLLTGTEPANGLYEMYFTLFDAATNGTQVGAGVSAAPVAVSNGLFTVQLDFGPDPAIFNGSARWLEIMLSVFGSDMVPVTLHPRQRITPTPYAIYAGNAAGVTSSGAPLEFKVGSERVLRLELNLSRAPNVIGGASLNTVTAGIVGATIAGGGSSLPGYERPNTIAANFGTIGGGSRNTIAGSSVWATIAGGVNNYIRPSSGWSAIGGGSDNEISADSTYTTIGGGEMNRVLAHSSFIGGGGLNLISYAPYSVLSGGSQNSIANSSDHSVIAGGVFNDIGLGGFRSTIGGGSNNNIGPFSSVSTIAGGQGNEVGNDSDHSTIGGGLRNIIRYTSPYGTVAGGADNTISLLSHHGSIGGGERNTISGYAAYSAISGGYLNNIGAEDDTTQDDSAANTIGGGYQNNVNFKTDFSTIAGGRENQIGTNSHFSTIGGGLGNVISSTSWAATIPGGRQNSATNFAFAAGFYAKAIHSGAFVWADFQNEAFTSTTNNEVSFRCAGGVRFASRASGGANQTVAWTPGAASWTFSSDRNLKENVKTVNGQEVLEKVSRLPVAEWTYKGYPQRHIGPMAQDFHDLFPLNDNDRALDSGDLHGITLAAIQGLNQRLQEELARRDAENAELKQRLANLEKALLNAK